MLLILTNGILTHFTLVQNFFRSVVCHNFLHSHNLDSQLDFDSLLAELKFIDLTVNSVVLKPYLPESP
jgi:hypothetical protein